MDDVDKREIKDLVRIQGTQDMVSKRELLDELRGRGADVTERQLAQYVTQGLIPRSMRAGSGTGAYPRIVVDLVLAIHRGQRTGLSIKAIKELIPLWKHLARVRREGRVDLVEFERVARRHVTSLEALYAVPWVFKSALPSPTLEADELAELEFVYKNDPRPRHHGPDTPVEVEFLIAEQDPETAEVRRRTSLLMRFPVAEDDRSPVVLGVPNGVQFPPRQADHRPSPRSGALTRKTSMQRRVRTARDTAGRPQ